MHLSITAHVRVKFGLPELWSRRGGCGISAVFVPVPEAAVNQDCGAILRQNEIRPTWQTAVMEAIPEAARMKSLSKRELRLCILAPNARHHS